MNVAEVLTEVRTRDSNTTTTTGDPLPNGFIKTKTQLYKRGL